MKSKAWFRELTIADFILVFMIMMAIVLSAIFLWRKRDLKQDALLYVYKNDVLWSIYPMDKNQVVKVDEHNSFEIRDQQVGMIAADCPDKRCVKQGFTSILPIICLPNKLVLEVKSGEEAETPHILY